MKTCITDMNKKEPTTRKLIFIIA